MSSIYSLSETLSSISLTPSDQGPSSQSCTEERSGPPPPQHRPQHNPHQPGACPLYYFQPTGPPTVVPVPYPPPPPPPQHQPFPDPGYRQAGAQPQPHGAPCPPPHPSQPHTGSFVHYPPQPSPPHPPSPHGLSIHIQVHGPVASHLPQPVLAGFPEFAPFISYPVDRAHPVSQTNSGTTPHVTPVPPPQIFAGTPPPAGNPAFSYAAPNTSYHHPYVYTNAYPYHIPFVSQAYAAGHLFGIQKACTADLKNVQPGESNFYEPPNGHGKEYLEEWCKGFDAGWKQGMMRRGVQYWDGGKIFVPDR